LLLRPMPLLKRLLPFDHADWIFEVKWDGFRALLYSDDDGVRLVSRNKNTFKTFSGLCEGLARDLKGRRCVLDGEIVCLDSHGKPQFRDLLFRRANRTLSPSMCSGTSTPGRMTRRSGADSATARTCATCR